MKFETFKQLYVLSMFLGIILTSSIRLIQNKHSSKYLIQNKNINYFKSFCSKVDLINASISLIDIKSLNLSGLKNEVARNQLRAFKKCVKATERYQKALKIYNDLLEQDNPDLESLENCPNIDQIKLEQDQFKERLLKLDKLLEDLKPIKTTNDANFPNLASMAIELGIKDHPPPVAEAGPKKIKGPKTTAPRKPYNSYTSIDGIEIRVGRSSSDNDELSINPLYRDGTDWWMHVAGSPGSHIVIRSSEEKAPFLHKETFTDAALLAAIYSKGNTQGKVPVNLCRCRDVIKPQGWVPGMVRLIGDVSTIAVEPKLEKKRLERLESTKNLIVQ